MRIETLSVHLPDSVATEQVGALLVQAVRTLETGMVIHLIGDLGAGKTTLSRGFIRALGHEGAVKSPTYTLVEPYEDLQPPVFHFDLYRLGDQEELEYMGIRDYLFGDALCLIEWPERGQGVLPPADCQIELKVEAAGRRMTLTAASVQGQALMNEFREALSHGWTVD